jgi:apolipoprotein N-acyltransferase
MLLVIAAGLVLYAASPPRNLWWLAPIAFAPLVGVVHGRRARAGFGYGLLFGLAYLLPLLGWLLDFLGAQFGPWPWLGVATVEALFIGLGGAGMAWVSRLRAAPVWMAAVFVATESLRSNAPFGGFPWGRLAFTQGSGTLLPLASLGGAVLVTFVVALIGAALAQFVLRLRGPRRRLLPPLAMVLVPVVAGLAVMPLIGVDPNAGTTRVALIQGNAPNVGLDLLYEDHVLHDNHVRAAEKYADDVRSGRTARPDVVVLPEQVGSCGPARDDPDFSRIAAQLGVPLVIGGLAQDGDSQLRNLVVRWDPVAGADREYVKQHLVPFAETIPMRPVARLVSPFVDRFQQDMVPGDKPGVLDVGPARLGVGLCYDVAYDDVFAGSVREGATLLAVPTNNAWYGYSEMSNQQLAMSQLRAVEHGRAVVVSATSGVSAVVQPDGAVTQQSEQFVAQNLTSEVPLRSTQTLATRLGSVPAWSFGLLGVGAVVFASWRRRRDRGNAQ